MNFFKFLLSKLIFIIFVLMVAYIYLYHEQLKVELAAMNTQQPQAKPSKAFVEKKATEEEVKVEQAIKKSQVAKPQKTETQQSVEQKPLPPSLKLARQYYWQHNYHAAIDVYQQLIKQDNKNPDYHGELGNIYLSQNKPQLAANEYVITAKILADNGALFRVQQLLGVLYSINTQKAEEVRNYLKNK